MKIRTAGDSWGVERTAVVPDTDSPEVPVLPDNGKDETVVSTRWSRG